MTGFAQKRCLEPYSRWTTLYPTAIPRFQTPFLGNRLPRAHASGRALPHFRKTPMPKRRIKRKRGEGITISGPATVHVSRRVTLVIDCPREARVARLARRTRVLERPNE